MALGGPSEVIVVVVSALLTSCGSTADVLVSGRLREVPDVGPVPLFDTTLSLADKLAKPPASDSANRPTVAFRTIWLLRTDTFTTAELDRNQRLLGLTPGWENDLRESGARVAVHREH